MVKSKAISTIVNTIKKLHIQRDMHIIYKQDFYMNKQKEMEYLFLGHLFPVIDDLEHPALIE